MKSRIMIVALVTVAFCNPVAWGQEETDYWSNIKELLQKDAPQGKLLLAVYMKSLTKEQVLIALRQHCKELEVKWPAGAESAGYTSFFILTFYAEPLKRSDLSDEEFRKMRRGKKRGLELGLLPARFTKKAFEKVITCISDQKEVTYFRYTLMDVFSTKNFYPMLSEPQKNRFLDTCLTVLNDRKSPDTVRGMCIFAMSTQVFQREYSHIIHADDVVKELLRTSEEEFRNLNSLLNSGEVKLAAKTMEQLAPLRRRIQDLRKKLADLLEDERESKSLKERAKRSLSQLDRFPLINAKDPAPKAPKN